MTDDRRLTGRHITLIVLATCVTAIAAPTAVTAVSAAGKHPPAVTIADGKHASRLARVTTDGAQEVKPTGTTTVSGAVASVPTRPLSPTVLNGHSTTNSLSVSAPSGHLVVQTVTVHLSVPATVTTAGIDISYQQAGQPAHLYVPLTLESPHAGGAAAIFAATAPASIYPDPGTTISAVPEYDAAVASVLEIGFSGYLS
jgi:hypothetical protein